MAVCTPPQQVCFPVSRQGEGSPAGGHTALSVLGGLLPRLFSPLWKGYLSFLRNVTWDVSNGAGELNPSRVHIKSLNRTPSKLACSVLYIDLWSPESLWTVETMLSSCCKLCGCIIDMSELSQDSFQVSSRTDLKSICARRIQALGAAVACCMESGHPRQAPGMKLRIVWMRSQGQHLAPKSSGSLLR